MTNASVEDNSVTGGSTGSVWLRFHSSAKHAMDNSYYRLGYWVATHPRVTIAISLLLVILCCFGFVNFTVESDGGSLWVPVDSVSMKQEVIVLNYFDDDYNFAVLLFESPSGSDGNLLTKEAFDKLWEIHEEVLSLETGEGNTFTDLCTKELDGVTCEQPFRGVTRFWGSNFTAYQAAVTNDEDLLASINAGVYPDGQAVNLEALFGNSVTLNDDGKVVEAAAMTETYLVESAREGEAKDESMAWQEKFIDFFEDEAGSYSDTFTVFYFASRSIDDALAESVTGEISLFFVTYTVMIVFVMFVIGRCCTGSVRRRTWLGLAGILFVLAAGLAAYGINSAFEVPFTALSQVLPFILIGIGVDDMLVIVASFDQTDASLEVEERVALALRRCGVSITYTSLTNFSAFMLGSLSLLPAVEYFCLYAATAILFDFFLQMTAFVACLALDARRQNAGKIDWCCCFTSKKFLEQVHVKRGVELGKSKSGDTTAKTTGVETAELSRVGRWMRDRYTPFILSMPGKILVLLATAGIFAAGIYGTTQARQGFDYIDLTPDDHYSRDYTDLARAYKLEVGAQYLPLNIYTLEVDYRDKDVQAQIQATNALMGGQEFVLGPIDSWLMSFVLWANASHSDKVDKVNGYYVYADQDTFYGALANFTKDGDNARFLSDIVYAEDKTIEISRTLLYLIDLTTTENNIDALKDSRDVVDASLLDPEPFAFSTVFIFTEQFLIIYKELITNFALALAAVAVLSFLALGQLVIVFTVCLTVAIIDVDLLGFVYHWGLEVNSITVIELIMAVGLVVDYMVHIVHYFLHQDGKVDKNARIALALGEIGPSVILGATTTFLGIMPMAFAKNFIFRVFFRMFLIIIAFGFYHGAVFVPVALSLIPDKLIVPQSSTVQVVKGSKDEAAVTETEQ